MESYDVDLGLFCPRIYAPSILGRCYKVEQYHKGLICVTLSILRNIK